MYYSRNNFQGIPSIQLGVCPSTYRESTGSGDAPAMEHAISSDGRLLGFPFLWVLVLQDMILMALCYEFKYNILDIAVLSMDLLHTAAYNLTFFLFFDDFCNRLQIWFSCWT